jgi:large subunit ribosomal protein L22
MAYRSAPDAQEAMARAKYLRISPTKARQVVDLIRGRHVEDARRILRFTSRAGSRPVAKLLNSAIANAEHNRSLPTDDLIVMRAWVDEGPTLKRFRPRALGRATRIRKRTCHIGLVVGREAEELPAATGSAETTRRGRRRAAEAADTAAGAAAGASAPAGSPLRSTPEAAGEPSASPSPLRSTPDADASSVSRAPQTDSSSRRKATAKKGTAKKTAAKKTTRKKTTRRKKED